MKSARQWIVTGLLGLSAMSAQAIPTVWTDTLDFNPNILITPSDNYEYTHDITDDGFDIATDTIINYSVLINLFDDSREDGAEVAYVNLPGLLGDRLFFSLSGLEFGGWSLAGHTSLQDSGLLDVTIDSWWGDFYLGDSTLIACGDDVVSVPEPGTLSLFGLGLLGLALAVRRGRRTGLQATAC